MFQHSEGRMRVPFGSRSIGIPEIVQVIADDILIKGATIYTGT